MAIDNKLVKSVDDLIKVFYNMFEMSMEKESENMVKGKITQQQFVYLMHYIGFVNKIYKVVIKEINKSGKGRIEVEPLSLQHITLMILKNEINEEKYPKDAQYVFDVYKPIPYIYQVLTTECYGEYGVGVFTFAIKTIIDTYLTLESIKK